MASGLVDQVSCGLRDHNTAKEALGEGALDAESSPLIADVERVRRDCRDG